LYLSGCTALTQLPDNLSVTGSLDLSGCTALTQLPDSLFNLSTSVLVELINTGLNATMVHRINERQNEAGYNGPRFSMSISDAGYLSRVDTSAQKLPELISKFGGTENHPLWNRAKDNNSMGSKWNSMAIFLTRLNNEVPRLNGELTPELFQSIQKILHKMEQDYMESNQSLDSAFINNILKYAEKGVGYSNETFTCIDKVKVGYLYMQLVTMEKMEVDSPKIISIQTAIKSLDKLEDFISDVAISGIVYNTADKKFIRITDAVSAYNEKNDNKIEEISNGLEIPLSSQYQIALSDLKFKGVPLIEYRIGDEVEDILNIAYQMPNLDQREIHKIDMRYATCCTLKDKTLILKAIEFINTHNPRILKI
jgi:hypothetical protein